MLRNILICAILGISIIVLGSELPGDRYTQLLGFHLNKTHLTEIQSKLGKAPVISSGDGILGSTRVNYYFKDNECYVTFNSDGLGGGGIVTHFILTTKKPKDKFYVKKNLNLSIEDLGGLRLGMTIDDVKKILGTKVKIKKNTYLLKFTGNRPMTEDEIKHFLKEGITIGENPQYFFQIGVYCKFNKDKVYEIIVYKSEQY